MNDTTTTNKDTTKGGETSVLATLRALIPNRRLQLSEALRIGELQADRLLRLRRIIDIPVPVEIVTGLPRIIVDYDQDLPKHAASGASDWDNDRRAWVIAINPDEPATRQRFTVLHEYKHIPDHYHPGLGGYLPTTMYGLSPVEYVAEYFAGCVLMPKRWVKTAYYDGIQRVRDLAELFDVSARAMEVRLAQLGITKDSDEPASDGRRYRLQPNARRPYLGARYGRPPSTSRTPAPTTEVAA
jgi:Zn-dependent peptidase ImmA (M78 family)